MTWPQGRSMGGESGELCSLETGHAKMLWNWNSGPSVTSAVAVSSPATFTRCNAASLISVGNALNPAVILCTISCTIIRKSGMKIPNMQGTVLRKTHQSATVLSKLACYVCVFQTYFSYTPPLPKLWRYHPIRWAYYWGGTSLHKVTYWVSLHKQNCPLGVGSRSSV